MTEEQIMTIRSRYNTIIGESTNHDEKFYSNTIRGIISETYIEEENSSHVLCYMGSYKM